MTEIRDDLLYTENDEWVRKKDSVVRIGITDYAQEHLTDVVYVELPGVGERFEQGDEIAVVESVKSVSEIYAPVSGEITAVNKELEGTPELVNESPYDEGWLLEMEIDDEMELETLLRAAAYEAQLD
ncbi:MAG: glycine cleavage system protein GcvH [Candidatus Thermoplasmatota archaeon]|nr:glycine cleavage system protein GcvH [Candidatus Thermoplasmatota archaeon]